MSGRSPTGRATRASTEPQEGLGHSASVPNASDYRLIAARWKGRERLLAEFCAARVSAGSGRVAYKMEDVGPIRYWPRLARRNVMIDRTGSIYDTRSAALDAARRYRAECRTIQSAIDFFRLLDAHASAIEARSDATPKSDAAEGESAVPQGDAK